jgi:5,10-methylenetetrahydromethanopterin reductase
MARALSFSFDGSEPPAAFREMMTLADRGGASTAWIACHLFQREPIAGAAIALGATANLRIALMAMSPYSVHPVYSAMAAATLDEYFPGRVTLCFGVGAPRDLEAAGLAASHPLGTLREAITLTRALFAGDSVTHAGERFQVNGRRLANGARQIPIFLAASGPQMLELAGAAADGVLISAATSPAFIRSSLELVARGEQRAGRKITKTALVYLSVDDDGQAARDRVRRTLGFVLRGQHHARNLELAGTRLDQSALAAAYAREDWATVEGLITDDVVTRHCAAGTPAQVREALKAWQEVGVDEIVASGFKTPQQLVRILETTRAG